SDCPHLRHLRRCAKAALFQADVEESCHGVTRDQRKDVEVALRHVTPKPSSDQNVPKDVSSVPTISWRRLRGIRVTGPLTAKPTRPMTTRAATAPITAMPV